MNSSRWLRAAVSSRTTAPPGGATGSGTWSTWNCWPISCKRTARMLTSSRPFAASRPPAAGGSPGEPEADLRPAQSGHAARGVERRQGADREAQREPFGEQPVRAQRGPRGQGVPGRALGQEPHHAQLEERRDGRRIQQGLEPSEDHGQVLRLAGSSGRGQGPEQRGRGAPHGRELVGQAVPQREPRAAAARARIAVRLQVCGLQPHRQRRLAGAQRGGQQEREDQHGGAPYSMIDSRGELGQERRREGGCPLAQKLDRKELKKPDEFQVVAGKAMGWMVAHQKPVLAGLIALAIAVLGAWGASAYSTSRETKAGAELAAALELSSRPLVSEAQGQPGVETFPSREERQKAALSALEKVRTDFPRSTAAQTAEAQIGFLELKGGDAKGAQAALQTFLDQAPGRHPLRPMAQESVGYALEAQGKLDEARAAFARLAHDGAPERAAFQEARIALVLGKPEARQQLEQVAKDYPKEPVALEANMRLELASLPPPGAPQAPPPKDRKPAAAASKGKK